MAEAINTKRFYAVIPKDWAIRQLGDVGKIRMCKRVFNHETSKVGDIPFYKIGTFGKEPDAFISKVLYESYRKKFSYPKLGDILISAAGTLGRTVVYDGSHAYFQDSNIVWIDNNESLVINAFLYYLYETIKYESEGGTIQRLYNSIIQEARFLCPPLPEQKAIAHVLSTADAAIHATEKLIAQKELQKKWLMQQLLTGKKRIKGFIQEWKYIRFGEIYSQVKRKAGSEKYIVLSVTKDGIVSQAEYFNKEIASEDTSPYLVIKKGDMVMSGLNFWMGSIDVLSKYEIGMVSPAYKAFEISNQFISSDFMKQFVRSKLMLRALVGSSVTGASIVRRNMDRETLEEWSFYMPPLEEQIAITKVLQAADKEIVLLKAKAEKLREQKKGLMQQLLTGKKRLNGVI